MTEQNNTKVNMNHNGTRSYQFQLSLNTLLFIFYTVSIGLSTTQSVYLLMSEIFTVLV
jgi:hypothetical protein